MPLEDDLRDILRKARVGQGLSVADVARQTGLPGSDITALERGDQPQHRDELMAVAKALGLRVDPLEHIAIKHWMPQPTPPLSFVETIHGNINGYAVKGYVLHDDEKAVIIDTGYNALAILDVLHRCGLELIAICLTHGHADHAEGIDRLLQHREVPVYVGPEDLPLMRWRPRADLLAVPSDGQILQVGTLTVRCMVTPGHTPGGMCYRLEQDGQRVCFVGDTIFAGSIGGSNPATLYATHLESVRRRVLKLPETTFLLPGHGPATTVREELLFNPFAEAG